jgi:hypothetical protein
MPLALCCEIERIPKNGVTNANPRLQSKVMVAADTEYPVEFLTSEPQIQPLDLSVRRREAEPAVTAMDKHVTAKDAEFFVPLMGVTNDPHQAFRDIAKFFDTHLARTSIMVTDSLRSVAASPPGRR